MEAGERAQPSNIRLTKLESDLDERIARFRATLAARARAETRLREAEAAAEQANVLIVDDSLSARRTVCSRIVGAGGVACMRQL